MSQLSKRAKSILYMQQNEALFRCPICAEQLQVSNEGNIAKQGYINLMHRPATTMYSKELFEARQQIIASGLYDPLQEKIAHLITEPNASILDTGCGEGSHLARICDRLDGAVGVGIDIAKEGILAAAKFYDEKIWCVGDLANSPYNVATFDIILNILSPANYDEFKRLLKPGGKVIKIVPQEGYLTELRAQAFAQSEKESYSNEQTVERFKSSFANVQVERITYTQPLAEELVPKLLEMTPMGWHIENREAIKLGEITIDLNILVGECE